MHFNITLILQVETGYLCHTMGTICDIVCGGGTINVDSVFEISMLQSPYAETDSSYGYSISSSGSTVIVGADGEDSGKGRSYVYSVISGIAVLLTTLQPIAADVGDESGDAVDVDESSGVLIAGALQWDSGGKTGAGSATVWVRNLPSPDAYGGETLLTASSPQLTAYYGSAVSVYGTTVLIGADIEDTALLNAGACYIHDQDFPTANAWNVRIRLTASDATVGMHFGESVSLYGDIAAVGAKLASPATVIQSGSVYIYERNIPSADSWGEVAILSAVDKFDYDYFASSVSLDDDTLAVGAHQDDDAGSASGSVYIFRRDHPTPNAWGELSKLVPSTAITNDGVASLGLFLLNDTVIAGTDQKTSYGSAWVWRESAPGTWIEIVELTQPSTSQFDDFFGRSCTIVPGTHPSYLVGASYWARTVPSALTRSGAMWTYSMITEACDDGNNASGDGCRSDCLAVESGWTCPVPGSPCTMGGTCGDSMVEGVEECDEGVTVNTATCDEDCTFSTCNDGVFNPLAGECDDVGGDSVSCDSDCTPIVCNDGYFNAVAECDDAGVESASCDSDCSSVGCADGLFNPTAGECDDAGVDSALCDSDCTAIGCADGHLNTVAECDDAGVVSASCDLDCTAVICGDGIFNPVAECNDLAADGPACDSDCTAIACGDGHINAVAGECDDAGIDSVSCDGDCTGIFCGDGYFNSVAESMMLAWIH